MTSRKKRFKRSLWLSALRLDDAHYSKGRQRSRNETAPLHRIYHFSGWGSERNVEAAGPTIADLTNSVYVLQEAVVKGKDLVLKPKRLATTLGRGDATTIIDLES